MNTSVVNTMLANSLRESLISAVNSPRYANLKFSALVASILSSAKFRRALKAADELFGGIKLVATKTKKVRKAHRRTRTVHAKKASNPVDPNAAPKKRGRPKGSKNKPKTEAIVSESRPEVASPETLTILGIEEEPTV
jgi:hypothetical protein